MGSCLGVSPDPAIGTGLQIAGEIDEHFLVLIEINGAGLLHLIDQISQAERQVSSTADIDSFRSSNNPTCTQQNEERIVQWAKEHEKHTAPDVCAKQRGGSKCQSLLDFLWVGLGGHAS